MSSSKAAQFVRTSDRSLRSLVLLQSNASTSRTLNLLSVWRRHSESEAYREAPFFAGPTLNRSIIVKHRLRANEWDDMPASRTTATKVILPIDPTDLRLGARAFFVGQRGYDAILEEIATGAKGDQRDKDVLEILDELPSLDPFLTRERLKKHGYAPDRCYFEVSASDAARMFAFAREELTPLIGVSFGDVSFQLSQKTALLAQKVMNISSDDELEPLRMGLGLEKPDFEEGVFCWKGFIYYKWALTDLLPRVAPLISELDRIKPMGPCDLEDQAYIESTKDRLCQAITQSFEIVRQSLLIYEDAYSDLTRNGQPLAFRDFLLKAPQMFHDLGERLGAVQHIISFWRFRFPEGRRPRINAEELVDILSDFENSIALDSSGGQRW